MVKMGYLRKGKLVVPPIGQRRFSDNDEENEEWEWVSSDETSDTSASYILWSAYFSLQGCIILVPMARDSGRHYSRNFLKINLHCWVSYHVWKSLFSFCVIVIIKILPLWPHVLRKNSLGVQVHSRSRFVNKTTTTQFSKGERRTNWSA